MPYEVVDPAERDERGMIYGDLTAAMVNAAHDLEVWELADTEAQERMIRCWPDPEHEPRNLSEKMYSRNLSEKTDPEHESVDEVTARRIVSQVRDLVSRADREASTIIADTGLPTNPAVQAVVSLAWSKGFVAGFSDYDAKLDAALDRIAGGEQS